MQTCRTVPEVKETRLAYGAWAVPHIGLPQTSLPHMRLTTHGPHHTWTLDTRGAPTRSKLTGKTSYRAHHTRGAPHTGSPHGPHITWGAPHTGLTTHGALLTCGSPHKGLTSQALMSHRRTTHGAHLQGLTSHGRPHSGLTSSGAHLTQGAPHTGGSPHTGAYPSHQAPLRGTPHTGLTPHGAPPHGAYLTRASPHTGLTTHGALLTRGSSHREYTS